RGHDAGGDRPTARHHQGARPPAQRPHHEQAEVDRPRAEDGPVVTGHTRCRPTCEKPHPNGWGFLLNVGRSLRERKHPHAEREASLAYPFFGPPRRTTTVSLFGSSFTITSIPEVS